MRIIVTHGMYGCDTGCCGHYIEVDGKEVDFDFSHPKGKEDLKSYAEELVKANGCDPKDLDWEHCLVVYDC